MAYDAKKPPSLLVEGITGAVSIWSYESADTLATVIAAGYVTNGDDIGMSVGDAVFVKDTTTPDTNLVFVTVVDSAGLVTMAA